MPVSYAFVYYGKGESSTARTASINPGRVIPDSAIAVHGITNERAPAEGDDLEDAIAEIVDALLVASKDGVPVVGMNVSYDLKMIDTCSRRVLGISLADAGWTGPVLDVLVIDRHFDKYRRGGRTLIDLCGTVRLTRARISMTRKTMLRRASRFCSGRAPSIPNCGRRALIRYTGLSRGGIATGPRFLPVSGLEGQRSAIRAGCGVTVGSGRTTMAR